MCHLRPQHTCASKHMAVLLVLCVLTPSPHTNGIQAEPIQLGAGRTHRP